MQLKLKLLFLIILPLLAFGQGDLSSETCATNFSGTSGINLGTNFNNISLPISITMWVKPQGVVVGGSATQNLFASNMSGFSRNGFYVELQNTSFTNRIRVVYASPSSFGFPTYRQQLVDYNSNLNGQWFHLAAVLDTGNVIRVFINGIEQTPLFDFGTGTSILSQSTWVAKIGNYGTAAFGAFNGSIDHLAIWNKALAPIEIRFFMCRSIPSTQPGLLAHYTFDDTGNTAKDHGPNGWDGTYEANVNKTVSGAPIGKKSAFLYTPSFVGTSLSLNKKQDTIEVRNISHSGGDLKGIHLYAITNTPNSLVGVTNDTSCLPETYWGVFPATETGTPGQANYRITPKSGVKFSSKAFTRRNNSFLSWGSTTGNNIPTFQTNHQKEWIFTETFDFTSTLPDTIKTCTFPITLTGDSSVYSQYWNNGIAGIGRNVTVIGPGRNIFTTTDSCFTTYRDTVWVIDEKSGFVPSKDLANQVSNAPCTFPLKLGKPILPPNVFGTWSTGATSDTLLVNGNGWVTLTLYDNCDTLLVDSALVQFGVGGLDTTLTFEVCQGTPLLLKPTFKAQTYSWNNGATDSTITINSAGTYIVEAYLGCDTLRNTFNINVTPVNQISNTFSLKLCEGEQKSLSATFAAESFEWSTGQNDSTIKISFAGEYTVKGIRGCDTLIDRFVIQNDPACGDKKGVLFIPTSFTPNNDGLNDFYVVSGRNIVTFEMEIYNRWGQLLFKTNNIEEGWDGTINGAKASVGAYSVHIRFTDKNGDEKNEIHAFQVM